MTKSDEQYEGVELTEQEMKDAIIEGKKKKWFRERHKDDWPEEAQDRIKPFVIHSSSTERRW